VTILGIVCGLSQKDCAEILNIPVTTVNNRLYKARQLLKKERGSIMERSSEIFEKFLMESRSKVDKVVTYLTESYDICTLLGIVIMCSAWRMHGAKEKEKVCLYR
jgi:predicted DNA-binding protein (UPF0251 family)